MALDYEHEIATEAFNSTAWDTPKKLAPVQFFFACLIGWMVLFTNIFNITVLIRLREKALSDMILLSISFTDLINAPLTLAFAFLGAHGFIRMSGLQCRIIAVYMLYPPALTFIYHGVFAIERYISICHWATHRRLKKSAFVRGLLKAILVGIGFVVLGFVICIVCFTDFRVIAAPPDSHHWLCATLFTPQSMALSSPIVLVPLVIELYCCGRIIREILKLQKKDRLVKLKASLTMIMSITIFYLLFVPYIVHMVMEALFLEVPDELGYLYIGAYIASAIPFFIYTGTHPTFVRDLGILLRIIPNRG